ncbi:MAG: FAD-binding oxidoreductase [Neisseriaceae bacterium]|nr:FAD-binding oxidoreductase [Neisseriaceae bacterium]MBP6862950.1 FAD-binding oxidoreductase [Neisseriaceae bacterium]
MGEQIIVIGAGMVGVGVAWHLRQRGHAVTLIDAKGPGMETSHGNAGLIQREAIWPHPFPRKLAEIIDTLPNQRLDIRYRLAGLSAYAGPLFQYWRQSTPTRVAAISKQWATLIEQCTIEHERMMTAAGASAQALVRQVGWLQLHRDPVGLSEQVALAVDAAKQHGVAYRVLNPAELQALEPDVTPGEFCGAIHWLNAWQVVNPGALVKAYADDFVANDGTLMVARVSRIQPADTGWQVDTDRGSLSAAKVVVAAGPWSMDLLAPLGYRFPLFPMRGYHMHYGLAAGKTLNHSIVDFDKGFVLSPMQQGIRMTTGAEMTTLTGAARFEQLAANEAVARTVLPLTEWLLDEPWFGARPCLPDMKPIIGPAPKHEGLWLAFGHGHQGFTLGPATGRLLGQMLDGDAPMVDPQPFSAQRFLA